MMFISTSDNKDDRLSNFTDNVEVHFAARKKVEILAKARNLLLQSNFVLPQENTRKVTALKNGGAAKRFPDHVVDLLFSSESCVVSKAACQLMKLVHQTLKDVCLSSPRVAWEFYHAARDALLLYEAVFPVKQEWQLDGINQVAVLIHNDCLYLSQEILGLAFEVVFILEKVHTIWEPLLLPSTYKRSMCMVLESVLFRMTKDILLLDDMAAEETLQMDDLVHEAKLYKTTWQ